MGRGLAAVLGCALWIWSGSAAAAVILLYHHVAEDTPAATSVTVEQFAGHLAQLKAEGFDVLRLDQLVAAVQDGAPASRKLAAITFDDAYQSIFRNARPLLAEYGWPATVFVATDAVGQGRQMMTVAQLQQLHREGHLLVNHTASHRHLIRRPQQVTEADWRALVWADIEQGQAQLTAWLGSAPPRYLAYPYGEHDGMVRELLAEHGYLGFAQRSGALDAGVDWQDVPRIPVNRHYAGWSSLGDKVRALPWMVSVVAPASPVTDVARPELVLTLPRAWQGRVQCFAGNAMEQRWQLDGERVQLRATPAADLPAGRTLVNCTAAAGGGRFHWHSHLWLRRSGAQWPAE